MGHGCHDCGCPNGCECVCENCGKRAPYGCDCTGTKCKSGGAAKLGICALVHGCKKCSDELDKAEPSGGFAYSPGMDPITEFDEYETANLLWLIGVAEKIGLNSGDWLGQVKHKLQRWLGMSTAAPNWDAGMTELALQMFATSRMQQNLDALGDKIAQLTKVLDAPIPMRLICPDCMALHVDEGEFATKPHHTHACQECGCVWRPAIVNTVGVQFLPGFKNEVK